ncbi:MAG: hypothetical protein J7K30_09755 [Deltaproteobacteria bacterium]|nr:hypothetical protein [Deltaproteobacteria bacterium]
MDAAEGSSPEYAMPSIQDTTGFETWAPAQRGIDFQIIDFIRIEGKTGVRCTDST